MFPEKLQEAYDLYDASFLWITSGDHPRFPTHNPSQLPFEVLRHISKGLLRDSLVYLGELDLFVEETAFLTVLEYVKHVIDLAAPKSCLVVASVAKGSVNSSHLTILEKRFRSTVA